jgi:hypothetical protein
MIKSRLTLGLLNIAAALLVIVWIHASHRINALNVGGEHGNVEFWMRVRDVGLVGSCAMLVLCFVAALAFAVVNKGFRVRERTYWILLPIVSTPLIAFGTHEILNAIQR